MRLQLPILLIALLLLWLPSAAQAQSASIAAAHLDRVGFLEGRWEGTGWIDLGPAGRHEFRQQEEVRRTAAGAVMVIEGEGVESLPQGGERQVHNAFAVLSWDPGAERYRIRAWRGDGAEVEDSPEIAASSLVWGFQGPHGPQVRFTVRIVDEVWHEVGEHSMDGETWRPFLEMHLRRIR